MLPGTLVLRVDRAGLRFANGVKHLANKANKLVHFDEAVFLGLDGFLVQLVVERLPMLRENQDRLSSNGRGLVVEYHLFWWLL